MAKMIYFGKSKNPRRIYGVMLFADKLLALDKLIPHYILEIRLGVYKYWIGINRVKRIKKNKLYELDGNKFKI
jgi:hypothetical protein